LLGSASLPDAIIGLAVLLVSVILHENAHGVAALALGDDTARKAGRITLNPISHLDIVGSVIIPAALFFTTGGMFGYAKPVPVTVSKLKGTDRTGFALVAAAGPVSNVLIAFVAVVVLKQLGVTFLEGVAIVPVGAGVVEKIFFFAFSWNLLLAAFNLLPIPPLDGSRFLRLFLKPNGRQMLDRFEPFGFVVLFLLIFMLGEPLFRLVGLIEDQLLRFLPL
jgi:Zn-dependent protease